MGDGGRHRSDRPAGTTGWAAILGIVALSLTVAALAVLVALLLL